MGVVGAISWCPGSFWSVRLAKDLLELTPDRYCTLFWAGGTCRRGGGMCHLASITSPLFNTRDLYSEEEPGHSASEWAHFVANATYDAQATVFHGAVVKSAHARDR